MNNYKKFFINTITFLFVSILIIIMLLLFIGYSFIGKNAYTRGAAYINYWLSVKNERAAELDRKGNKIVFCSGSNTLHGLNSKYASEVTGLPILNYGLHAAFGDYIFTLTEKIIKPGDIVILPLEFPYYETKAKNSIQAPFAEWVISFSPEYYKNSPFTTKLSLSFFLIKTCLLNPGFDYSENARTDKYESALNKYGDYLDHEGTTDKFLKLKLDNGKITQEIPKNFNELPLYNFIKYCRKNNISVYGMLPNYYHTADFSEEDIKNYNIIKAFFELNGAYFIGDYKSGAYGDKMMFHDTAYHLNTKGSVLRTKWIIENVLSIPEIKNINK